MTSLDPAAAIEEHLREQPDDREAWRVYGDLLLERGDRRGELIMLSLHNEGRHDPQLDAPIVALEQALRAASTIPTTHGHWRYGFLVEYAEFIHRPADIRELAALLDHPDAVLLHTLELAFDPEMRRGHKQLEQLDLRRIRRLRFVDQKRGDTVLRAIATRGEHRFHELDLRNAGITYAGIDALARLAEPGTLRRLHLQRNRIHGKALVALVPKLAELELLDLRQNPIGELGVRALAEAPTWRRLRTLRLHARDLDEASLRALAESTTLPHPVRQFWRGALAQRFPRALEPEGFPTAGERDP